MVARTTHTEEWLKLSQEERKGWLGFLRVHTLVMRELDEELKEKHGLALSSYDVLLQVGRTPDGRIQMFELADAVQLSRSGLTRLVERLEREGLLERERGPDPRTVFATITDPGLERLAEATPTHLAGVRRLFLEPLSKEQLEGLADEWERLLGAGGNEVG